MTGLYNFRHFVETLRLEIAKAERYEEPLACIMLDIDNFKSVNDTHVQFIDTSGTYQSIVALVCYDFSAETLYTSAADWARANFIAYSFFIYADPFSSLVFYDSVTARQNGTLWAADAFILYYSFDSAIDDWAEYVRYTGA